MHVSRNKKFLYFQFLHYKIFFPNIFELRGCSTTISKIILSNTNFLPPSPQTKPNLSELTLAAVSTQNIGENWLSLFTSSLYISI